MRIVDHPRESPTFCALCATADPAVPLIDNDRRQAVMHSADLERFQYSACPDLPKDRDPGHRCRPSGTAPPLPRLAAYGAATAVGKTEEY